MVEIDLNVRCENNWTFTRLRDLPAGCKEGDALVVIERESGLTFPATIARIDHTKGIGYLAVAWEQGRAFGRERV